MTFNHELHELHELATPSIGLKSVIRAIRG